MLKEHATLARKANYALRCVGHLIRKRAERSDARKYIDSLTGTRGYIICYLKDNENNDVFQRDIGKEVNVKGLI